MMNLGVLFGGKSGEHEVSLRSAASVMANLNKSRYRVWALAIRPDGSAAGAAQTRSLLPQPLPGVIPAGLGIRPARQGQLVDLYARAEDGTETALDLFFPVLHGTFGEDGTIQGLLDLTGKPYVGCGTMGSAVGMDKEIMKNLFCQAGLPVLPFLRLHRSGWLANPAEQLRQIEQTIGFPCFVKPARLGSSVGISRVAEASGLAAALETALAYDYKVLVEVGIPAREIECSVMGNAAGQVSPPGEIVPDREFYDYRAKYQDSNSELLLPAPLTADRVAEIRELAARAFAAIGGEGFGRVDFLLDRRDGQIYVNEINTIPGFTDISMFPKLWTLDGMTVPDLLDRLVELAMERQQWRETLLTGYHPGN